MSSVVPARKRRRQVPRVFERAVVDSAGRVTPGRLRSRLLRVVGGYAAPLRWYRRLRPRWLWERANPNGKATRRYVAEHGLFVRSGPFAGLMYPSAAIGNASFLPIKLLGAYERELAPALLDTGPFELFVDIGSGEGYYCVGFKRRFPETRVIGYETDRFERVLSAKLARVNGVHIETRGTADHAALNALPAGRLLLMCDVEGYEIVLADPAAVPRLREATMVIEVHPEIHPEVVDVLIERFAASHDIEHVHGRTNQVSDHRELIDWDPGLARYAISEGRASNPLWLVLRPRGAQAAA